MRILIKKCVPILFVLCLMSGCNNISSPQTMYGIGDPVDGKTRYVALNSVTKKNNIIIDGKKYKAKEGNTYVVLDLNVRFEKPFSFDTVEFAEGCPDKYDMDKEFSQKLSNISDTEWTSFTSSDEKHIQLVFEGADKLENLKVSTFYLAEPFLIVEKDITVE